MAVSTRGLGAALRELVGADRVSDAPGECGAAAVDGRTPRWVVRAADVEHVAGVLTLAWEESLAVAPRGSGFALELGRPPERLDIVLDLRGLDRVVEDSPADLTVSIEAGISAGMLADRLAARRQWLPVDPPGWRGRTLGGLAATGASGPLRVRYGTLRDLVLGVRFVQADGVVTWGGARVVKSVTGYDVPKLMVGALGTLGVLVELTLRLHPMPAVEGTWLALFRTPEAAQAFTASVLDAPLQPSRLEFLNEAALRACQAPPAPAAVAVSVGSVEAAVREQGEMLVALAGVAGGAASPADADFWSRYDAALVPAAGEVVLQVGTLPSRLAETVAAIAAVGVPPTALVTGAGALGALRVAVTGVDVPAAGRLVTALRDAAAALGGHVVVHAGPPALRTEVDPWGPVDPGPFALMRALKDEFDARRVLNPGRFVGGL
jgi:glycolate oxidase FAD binding subunit